MYGLHTSNYCINNAPAALDRPLQPTICNLLSSAYLNPYVDDLWEFFGGKARGRTYPRFCSSNNNNRLTM
ncbi:hypothetical protein I7I48_09501 [Histoplasma ohiense]|nr:hypothetical protein I7I48_09501 [Histoplasma ohiense (nom. inval.)]